MLEILPGLPPHVVGVRATGRVTEADLTNTFLPAAENARAAHEPVHFLILLENETGDWSLGQYGKDPKAALRFLSKGSRVAVVTGEKKVRTYVGGLSFFIPGKAKGFDPDAAEEAKAWMMKKDEADDFME